MNDLIPRCVHCQGRHEDPEDCHEPGEEGHISREELLDAFRMGYRVCLPCQSIQDRNAGRRCPDCGGAWERFGEDDLPGL